ncbi:MAG: hypothetical protein WBV70_02485 [Candidatus Bathyarchaeia archaeon]
MGRLHNPVKITPRFVAEMAFFGFILTFTYDVLLSIGFHLAYFIYPSVWDAIYMTFVPAFLPYPPIIHTATNTVVFMLETPALIVAMRAPPPQWRASGQRFKPVKGKALK